MWVDERIFSKGDLSEGIKGDKYSEFIEYEHYNNLYERLEHVEQMIDRLQAEKDMLEEHFEKMKYAPDNYVGDTAHRGNCRYCDNYLADESCCEKCKYN